MAGESEVWRSDICEQCDTCLKILPTAGNANGAGAMSVDGVLRHI